MKSPDGSTIMLDDFSEIEDTTDRLEILPDEKLLENGTMLCGFHYDIGSRRICAQPLCIIPDTENTVVRLLY